MTGTELKAAFRVPSAATQLDQLGRIRRAETSQLQIGEDIEEGGFADVLPHAEGLQAGPGAGDVGDAIAVGEAAQKAVELQRHIGVLGEQLKIVEEHVDAVFIIQSSDQGLKRMRRTAFRNLRFGRLREFFSHPDEQRFPLQAGSDVIAEKQWLSPLRKVVFIDFRIGDLGHETAFAHLPVSNHGHRLRPGGKQPGIDPVQMLGLRNHYFFHNLLHRDFWHWDSGRLAMNCSKAAENTRALSPSWIT